MPTPAKADPQDTTGRFREIISDPLNLLIERTPTAGMIEQNLVHLHNGHRVPVIGPGAYYGDFSAILILNRGVHEPLEEYVFQQMLPHLPVSPFMLELGAYWGHYSMWLKQARAKGHVCLVEPDENNLAAGRANFALNSVTGEFIRAFVGTGHFELDRFVSDRGLKTLDVLHADIQGYEVQMLDGAQQSLRRKVPGYVFVSTHSQPLHLAVVERLRAWEYRVEVSADFDAQTTSFDGLVFASSPERQPVFEQFTTLGREEICRTSARIRLEYLSRLARTQT